MSFPRIDSDLCLRHEIYDRRQWSGRMDTYKKGKALVKNSQRLLGSDERFSYFQQAHLTIKWQLSQRRDGNKPVTFWKTAALSHSGDVFLEKQQQPVALGDIGCKQFPRGVFKNSP